MSLPFMAVHLQMERVWTIYVAADSVNYLCSLIQCSQVLPSTKSNHKGCDYITIQSFPIELFSCERANALMYTPIPLSIGLADNNV